MARGLTREAATAPLRRLREDRRRARAARRAGRAGGEDHRGHAGDAPPPAGRDLRAPARARHRSRLRRLAARPLHVRRRRAGTRGIRVPGPAVCRLAVRAAGPADVSQRGRSRPDSLRHHLSRRDVAGAAPPDAPRAGLAGHRPQGADAPRALRRAGAVPGHRTHAPGRDPRGPGRRHGLAARRARARARAGGAASSPAPISSTRGSTSPACRTRASATRW